MADGEDFLSVSKFCEVGSGEYEGTVPASWMQGRATFGGLVASIALRPMHALIPDERRLRSVQVNFVGPLAAEPARCSTRLLRAGRALSLVESRITQGEKLCCTAIGAFAEPRQSSVALRPPIAPEPPGPGLEVPYLPDLMPPFLKHFKLRWDNDVYPGSGASIAHVLGGVRYAEEARPVEVYDLLALLDVCPPALVTMLQGNRWSASTVSWTVDFLQPMPAASTAEYFRFEARGFSAHGGYGQTDAWLWSPTGEPAARSTQFVAIFE